MFAMISGAIILDKLQKNLQHYAGLHLIIILFGITPDLERKPS